MKLKIWPGASTADLQGSGLRSMERDAVGLQDEQPRLLTDYDFPQELKGTKWED